MGGDRSLSGNASDSQPLLTAANSKGSTRKRKLVLSEDEEAIVVPSSPNTDDEQQGEDDSNDDDGDSDDDAEDDNDDDEVDVKPIGSIIRVSGKGESIRNHYIGFEADGVSYNLEDTVLVSPENVSFDIKPSVAMIKDITTTHDGTITVIGQMFYRPESAETENRQKWKSDESRELFYSFDKEEFSADSVMHKCKVHFVPLNKKIPNAKHNPGFVVQKMYDPLSKKLKDLLDTSYEDGEKHEINLLIQKTINRISN